MRFNYEKSLSEAVHMDELKPHYLNIVEAPVGSGKTYWALNVLAKRASVPARVIYLIDTINGRNQLIAQNEVSEYSDKWFYVVSEDMMFFDEECTDKVVVMTYGKFGSLVERYRDFGQQFEYIICDEIHSLSHFSSFSGSNANAFHRIAQLQIETIIKETQTIVIGLSATPERAERHMNCEMNYVTVDKDVRRLTTEKTHTYTNLLQLLSEQSREEKGILYIEQIEKMKEICSAATEMGFRTIALWSPKRVDKPMTDAQRAVLNHIIEKEALPETYNLFIINASCETSINIHSPVDYIIVHKQEKEAQVQVRGRYRDTLKHLYFLDYKKMPDFPSNKMGIRLYSEDRKELCRQLNLRNENGRLRMWPSIESMLIDKGYHVICGKDKIGRYRIVTQ